MGNERRLTIDGRALRLYPVAADAFSELVEILSIRIQVWLLARLHRGRLPPVRLGLEPFREFACSVCSI